MSYAITMWRASTFFTNIWPSIIQSWTSPSLIWKRWRGRFWQTVLPKLQRRMWKRWKATALADLCLFLTFLKAFSPFLLNKNTVPWTHYFEHVYILASWKQYFWAHLFWACLFTLILCFMLRA